MQARKTGQVGKDVVNQYFGIFFLIFQSSGVWGNLISSLVFGQTPTQGKRKWGPPRAPGPSPHVLIRDMGSCHMGPKTCFSDCPLPSSCLDSLGGSEGPSGPRVPWPPLLREGALGTEAHYLWSASSWSPSVQFSSVAQSCPTLCNPWTAARQASLSITNSQSLLKLMSIELVMPSNHLIVCHLLLLPPSIFPSIRIFSSESVLHIRWPKYWSFSFSISPSNEYSRLISFRMDWLDLLAVQGTLKSLFQHHSLKASIPWHSAFFMVQLSHPYTSMESLLSYRLRMVSVNLFSC